MSEFVLDQKNCSSKLFTKWRTFEKMIALWQIEKILTISTILAFLKCPWTINKSRSQIKLLLQLGWIKLAITHTSYKKVSSDQELNSIDSSWVNRPSVDNFCHFR